MQVKNKEKINCSFIECPEPAKQAILDGSYTDLCRSHFELIKLAGNHVYDLEECISYSELQNGNGQNRGKEETSKS